jgi:hypothetical protein
MALPSSGQLAFSQINNVFGRGVQLSLYRGTTWVTPQGGSGNFSNNEISFGDFYNKAPFWFFGGDLNWAFRSQFNGWTVPGSYFCGPHNFSEGSYQGSLFWQALAMRPPFFVNIFFPNGRPANVCRIRLPGYNYDTSTGDWRSLSTLFPYSGPGGFFSHPAPGTAFDGTHYTEVYLFN